MHQEWEDYQAQDPNGDLFKVAGVEKRTCSWAGDDRGVSGADWWQQLPFDRKRQWPTLYPLAIKVLSQTSTESAAERHFSAVEVVQPKTRASLSPSSLEKRTFVRAEIQGELATRRVGALLTIEDLDRHEASGRDDAAFAEQPEDPAAIQNL